jgi:ABC-2 type transport system ATP-binding protein
MLSAVHDPTPLLEASGLHKRFDQADVLAGAGLAADPGTVIGLLGPNGAGKTTLLNILAGILPPDSGTVAIGGVVADFDRRPETRKLLGLMLGGRTLVEDLRPREYFDFLAAIHALARTDTAWITALTARLRLTEHLEKPIRVLSAGTRKKVEFVGAVLHRPRVLLLDEPFEAIDPPAVHELTAAISDYIRESAAAAVISSHILPYVRPLATEVLLLWNGRLYEQPALISLLEANHHDSDLQEWGAVLQSA